MTVVLPLVDGRQAGWSAWSWAALAAAVPLAIAFAVHQRRNADRGGVHVFFTPTGEEIGWAQERTAAPESLFALVLAPKCFQTRFRD